MKRLAVILAVAAFGVSASNASAWSSTQARATAVVWMHQHCGESGVYDCDWVVLTSLTQTGINQKGRAQWKFAGNDEESRIANNPFLPELQGCTLFGYIDPYGTILGAGKVCTPVVI